LTVPVTVLTPQEGDMSETVVTEAASAEVSPATAETETATPEAEAPATDEGKVFDADYVKSLRQEAAKYRTQAKDMAEKAKAYDEYVESQKSESQRIADALEAATKERDTLQSELLRLQVAAKKNLPGALSERLRGTTLEEMEADADALLAGLKDQFVAKQKPTPDQTGAGVVGDSPEPTAEDFLNILKSRS
jgi:hypothetical protein